jgi:hypothetical protein
MWTTMKTTYWGKNFWVVPSICTGFVNTCRTGFPIINSCNPGVHYETPCINSQNKHTNLVFTFLNWRDDKFHTFWLKVVTQTNFTHFIVQHGHFLQFLLLICKGISFEQSDFARVIEVRQPVCWLIKRDKMGQNFGLQTQAGTYCWWRQSEGKCLSTHPDLNFDVVWTDTSYTTSTLL